MGMFDYVDAPPQPCWKCGALVTGWQSKDADCALDTVPMTDVRRFYDTCPSCGAWNEYRVIATAAALQRREGDTYKEDHEWVSFKTCLESRHHHRGLRAIDTD